MGGLFDPAKLDQELSELKKQTENPAIWEEPKKAQAIGRRISHIEDKLRRYNELEASIGDSIEIASLAEEEGDMSLLDDLGLAVQEISGKVRNLELETLLSGAYDSRDAIVTPVSYTHLDVYKRQVLALSCPLNCQVAGYV